MQQNTDTMEAQIRDAMTAKQMNLQMAIATDMNVEKIWDNGLYQYNKGLFDQDEFQPRMGRWQGLLQVPDFQRT
jgi:hypothetical protein